jgi:uncharacterized protein (TIGR02996 family)
VSEREAFLQWLAENEDDTTARLVYADWLDEHGEHEEADRQRKWPAAKEWLVRFCKENSRYEEYAKVCYERLLEFGRQVAAEESSSYRVYLDNEALWDALQTHSQEFWKNWSIVTCMPLPPSLEDKGFHYWECCPHEVYFWFGTPDPSNPDE